MAGKQERRATKHEEGQHTHQLEKGSHGHHAAFLHARFHVARRHHRLDTVDNAAAATSDHRSAATIEFLRILHEKIIRMEGAAVVFEVVT